MNEREILELKELIVEPVIKEVQGLKEVVYQNSIINDTCHKEIKADLKRLNEFKSKVVALGSLAGMIGGSIMSYIVSRFTNGK